jgi:mannose-1-phosphate guanylyltransferase
MTDRCNYCRDGQKHSDSKERGGSRLLGWTPNLPRQQQPDGATHCCLGNGKKAALKGIGRLLGRHNAGDAVSLSRHHKARRGFVSLFSTIRGFSSEHERSNPFGFRMNRPIYVLILAGGSGERFWPLSRKARPKQLLSLLGEESMIESTVRRLEGFVSTDRILILTNAEQEEALRALDLPLPPENIVAEPAKRDTAAAIALGVGWISARDPDALMIVLPADHMIGDRSAFQQTLLRAASAAEQSLALVTIGIPPTWACPGFGYIEQGQRWEGGEEAAGAIIHKVARFREKPDAILAETFLQQGGFRWNAGMFVWTVESIRRAFAEHAPALEAFLQQWPRGGACELQSWLAQTFPVLPKISVDYAILEKASQVLVVEANFDWDDVGSWTAISKYLPSDSEGNTGNCVLHAIEASSNMVFSEAKTPVALLGVRDLIVIQTADALLVCHRRDAEKVKQFMPGLPPQLL